MLIEQDQLIDDHSAQRQQLRPLQALDRHVQYGNQHTSAASSTLLLVMILMTVGADLRLVGLAEVVR